MTARLVAAAILILSAQPALAHPPPLGIGGFPGGLLHPLFVPAHAMAILALGLLIGRQSWTRPGIVFFVIGIGAGLGVMTLGVVPFWMNELVLAGALAAGLLAALDRPLHEMAGGVFAVLTGFCIALDSPPETISLSEANRMLLGTGVGATAMLLVAVAVAARLGAGRPRVAARIVGSWIAASAILVLVLRFAR